MQLRLNKYKQVWLNSEIYIVLFKNYFYNIQHLTWSPDEV